MTAIYQLPSAAHPLGTDSSGRDVFNQIIHGGRDILTVGLIAGFFSTLIAVTFGSIAAVVGGKVDSLISGATDFWLTIPHIPIIVLLGSILKFNSIFVIAAFLALLAWAGLLRQVRAQVLSLKERDYVEAARSLDLGLFHIIFKEILPQHAQLHRHPFHPRDDRRDLRRRRAHDPRTYPTLGTELGSHARTSRMSAAPSISRTASGTS